MCSKHWLFTLLLCSCVVNIPTSLAWEIPYGVQHPMHAIGFPACDGGEIGYWQYVVREKVDKSGHEVFLVLTTVDIPADPAFVICYVHADRKVMALGPEKHL